MNSFLARLNNKRLENFVGPSYWNFYEWRPGLSGANNDHKSDLISSCLFLLALESMGRLSSLTGKEDRYSSLAASLREFFNKEFYSSQMGLYSMYEGEDGPYSELGNSLAIIASLPDEKQANDIAIILKQPSSSLTPISLSCLRFVYDALLKVSEDNKEFILQDIDVRYKKMLDSGATTCYETELGAADFDGAGSLCHGWSALPIYYYHLFGIGETPKKP